MELKEYQLRALKDFDRWHNALKQAREDSEATTARYRAAGLPMPPDIINYSKTAWQGLAERDEVAGRHHIDRQDGAGRPIPHTCFKVPTGGGKTLLAAAALERIQYPTGLVLWILSLLVPSTSKRKTRSGPANTPIASAWSAPAAAA